MAQALRYPTSQNFVQKTLGAQLLAGATASATFNNLTGIQNKPGVFIVDRVDTNGVETPTKREVIQFTATSGLTVTTLTRNADTSGTDQDHAVGAIVEFGPDILWAQSVIDGLSQVLVPSTGVLDTTKVVDLTTTQALTNKTLTDSTNNVTARSLKSATTTVDVSSATAPSSGQVLTATGSTTATWQTVTSDGWTSSSDTWTYASASTFTISGVDRTAVFTKGTRLKFTQTTDKYAVVVSSSFSTNTTVTIAVNTDYTIANAAITSPYYSYQLNPQGYPGWFSYTPTWSGFSSDPSSGQTRFRLDGSLCTLAIHANTSGTSNATTFTITAPVTSKTITGGEWGVNCITIDNSGAQSTPGCAQLASNSTTITLSKTFGNTSSWTSSGTKNAWFTLLYEI